jgi:hypothetical protein
LAGLGIEPVDLPRHRFQSLLEQFRCVGRSPQASKQTNRADHTAAVSNTMPKEYRQIGHDREGRADLPIPAANGGSFVSMDLIRRAPFIV